MYQEQRLTKIVELLKEKGELSAKEMMAYFQVSRDTIRRDSSILEERKLVTRTHGGIIPLERNSEIPSFSDRVNTFTKEKTEIAQKALAFIEPNSLIFFDVSTIILKLAQLVDEEVEVYSHSLDNAIMFSERDRGSFHLLGGKFYPRNRFYYSLNEAELLMSINFDVAFIGAVGLKNGQVSFEDREDAYIKQLVMKQAKKKILLAEHTKGTIASKYTIGSINDFDYWITDAEPDAHERQQLSRELKVIF
ncbi:DeoR/GlpR family DNA-binding transcription regulator [Candidatus Enterococcus clewellii]|uniref:DeoR family transcriptional regulator, carbon catabolite repression regulator n=1 Tax=Candidatus Enterococcus clewellii TaxID=1834193 RepID=A0A242K965_9ENTE|nr:DeoR/GlpR family DNA-binding transcription regulator [Enterococcus sp. 9E7_DIV0242]OTP17711.1 hypothetical protein A5888_001849 [Enterococcus sp. 9E7_DIV0242]